FQPPFEKLLGPTQRRDLGNLLLAFVMMWAYLSFSQFLLIWSENLPEEIPWYLKRTRGGWLWLALLLVVFQFSLPFLLLLSREIKQDPRRLAVVALLVLVMRYLDVFWWIEPAFSEGVHFYVFEDLRQRQNRGVSATFPLALKQKGQALPPQPQLEGIERMKERWGETLPQEPKLPNKYEWVDRQAGVVRIPMDWAMAIIVERKL